MGRDRAEWRVIPPALAAKVAEARTNTPNHHTNKRLEPLNVAQLTLGQWTRKLHECVFITTLLVIRGLKTNLLKIPAGVTCRWGRSPFRSENPNTFNTHFKQQVSRFQEGLFHKCSRANFPHCIKACLTINICLIWQCLTLCWTLLPEADWRRPVSPCSLAKRITTIALRLFSLLLRPLSPQAPSLIFDSPFCHESLSSMSLGRNQPVGPYASSEGGKVTLWFLSY